MRCVLTVALIGSIANVCGGQANQIDKFDAVKRLDMPVAGGPMLAICRINGQEVQLVVNTHSAMTSLTAEAAKRIGLRTKSTVVSIGSISEQIEVCEGLQIEIGTLKVVPRNGVRVSATMSNSVGPIKRDGSIGMDALSGCAIWMDLGANSAAIIRPLMGAPTGEFEKVPLSFNTLGYPMIVITTDEGQMVECVLDSSALATIGLHSSPFDLLTERRDIIKLPYTVRATISSQSLESQVGLLSSCRLGELELKEPKVFRVDRNFVGLWALARFQALIDFPAKSLYLKKGLYFGAVDSSDRYGIEVTPVKGGMKVIQVAQGTLLSKLGLRQGDEILSVGKHMADEDDGWRANQTIGYFKVAPVEMRVRRSNEVITIELPASLK